MCEPKYYGIFYEINPWMDVKKPAISNLAQQQWQKLYETIQEIGATVELVPPVSGIPDMVFTANAALVHNKQIWLSTFFSPQRQPESIHFKNWFLQAGYEVINDDYEKSPTFEGAGDALFIGDRLIAGYGFRSNSDVYKEAFFQPFKPILCELADPYFYHLDTCFCPLDSERAIWYPPAFSIDAQTKLNQACELIHVTEAEAKQFACNAIVIDKHVILPSECNKLSRQLESLGFITHPCDMSEYIKAGGACKCLTLNLSEGR
jgi:N-dimethylarginine dimethylaminohydrolase